MSNITFDTVLDHFCKVLQPEIRRVAEQLWVRPPGEPVAYWLGEPIGFESEDEKTAYLGLGLSLEDVAFWFRQVLQAKLIDGWFRVVHPGLGYGYKTALEKASTGDEQAMLAVVSAFPRAQLEEPCLAEPLKQMFRNPGFVHRYREVIGKPPKPSEALTSPRNLLLFALCFSPDLLREQRTSMNPMGLTALEIMDRLPQRGVDFKSLFPGGVDSFGTFVRRRFGDFRPKQS
ncbi:MAG TPA: hypothetical protein VKB81_11705 [Nitrospira sp.]|nr:hypothetical protein [Nitrospira sp.]